MSDTKQEQIEATVMDFHEMSLSDNEQIACTGRCLKALIQPIDDFSTVEVGRETPMYLVLGAFVELMNTVVVGQIVTLGSDERQQAINAIVKALSERLTLSNNTISDLHNILQGDDA